MIISTFLGLVTRFIAKFTSVTTPHAAGGKHRNHTEVWGVGEKWT